MTTAKHTPERIRVAQDAEGFWTCREAISGSQEYVRSSIVVAKLDREIHDGDWHDKPLRWTVKGPGQEVQNFSTKASATRYRSIRRTSSSLAEASNRYVREA